MREQTMDQMAPRVIAVSNALDRQQPVTNRDYERRWWTLGVLCLSLLMIVMANASLNVALPTLAKNLDTGSSGLQWIVDAYSLAFVGLLLTAGSLGDRYGRRLALNGGLIVFGAGSLFAVISSSSGAIIGARAVMGAGAAFVMPATLSILAHVFPPEERPRAIAIWAGVAGLAVAMGGVASRRAARAFLVGVDLPCQRGRSGRRAGRRRHPHPALGGEDPRATRPSRRRPVDRRAGDPRVRDHRGARPRVDLDANAGDVRSRGHDPGSGSPAGS